MKRIIYLLLLSCIPLGVSAQSNEQFYADLSQAWQAGNAQSLTLLLDEELDFSQNGKEGRLSKEQVEGQLSHFFSAYQPAIFTFKHKGSSQDGQLYLIGQLETNSGSRYKIVCRAKPVRTTYRIIRLDLANGR